MADTATRIGSDGRTERKLVCQHCKREFWTRYKRKFCSRKCFLHKTPSERFWVFVRFSKGCWEWTGATFKWANSQPYGRFKIGGTTIPAHRASWLLNIGPIPNKLLVCHHCDNPRCVRPDHLFVGTYKDNTQDMIAKNRHPFPGPKNPRRGENCHSSKLTEQQVLEIRSLYKPFIYGYARLAKRFGVSRPSITAVVKRETWIHV